MAPKPAAKSAGASRDSYTSAAGKFTTMRSSDQVERSPSNMLPTGSNTPLRRISPAASNQSDLSQTGPSAPAQVSPAGSSRGNATQARSTALPRRASPAGPSRSATSQLKVNKLGFTTLADCAHPVADIVFVHGLQGHPERTWTGTTAVDITRPVSDDQKVKANCLGIRKEQKVFWPKDLLPVDRQDIRVMTYEYDSHIVKMKGLMHRVNNSDIEEHGESFLQGITSKRLTCLNRPLIFVAHSLGGLVVKEALVQSRYETRKDLKSTYEATFATIFFGTPHRGSDDAAWGQTLGCLAVAAQFDTNTRILHQLNPAAGNSKLSQLRRDFSRMLHDRGIQVHSFLEAEGKIGCACLGGQVVHRDSSGLDEPHYELKDFINANHMNMCKFKGRDDDGYVKFLSALNRYISGLPQQTAARDPEPPSAEMRAQNTFRSTTYRNTRRFSSPSREQQQTPRCM
ncbi:MAG: hypothetical protein Q9164_007527 [Protoblastenia rupestris]